MHPSFLFYSLFLASQGYALGSGYESFAFIFWTDQIDLKESGYYLNMHLRKLVK